MSRNDTGIRLVEFSEEQVAFLKENCDANIRLGMNYLQLIHDGKAPEAGGKQIVELIENFKGVKERLEAAS